MKTNLSFAAVGGLVLLTSCATGPVKSHPNPAPAVPLYQPHPINVSFLQQPAYGPDSGYPWGDEDSWQTTWSFLNENNDSALNETIAANEAIEWHFNSKFFLFIDENKSSLINWDKCTDENGHRLNWKNLPCPFKQPKHRGLDSGPDGTIRVVIPPDAAPNAPKGYPISYRLVTSLEKAAGPRAMPYNYYMVETTLVWDSSVLRLHQGK